MTELTTQTILKEFGGLENFREDLGDCDLVMTDDEIVGKFLNLEFLYYDYFSIWIDENNTIELSFLGIGGNKCIEELEVQDVVREFEAHTVIYIRG